MVTVNGCARVRKGRTDVREKDWILHQPGLGDHQADQRRARGSGILKRGRQGHATLCLSQDTSGTDCRDYKSELSDRVLESARRNTGGIQDPRHFMCPYGTTPRDFLGWDTHKTKKQRKQRE